MQIQRCERGSAAKMLLMLRNTLEKVYPPTDIAVVRGSKLPSLTLVAGKMGDNQPALRIAHTKAAYDKQQSAHFKLELERQSRPQREVNMEKHLGKYTAEQRRQEEARAKYFKEQREIKEKMSADVRKAQINKMIRNAGFIEEWTQKGVEEWKKNMTV